MILEIKGLKIVLTGGVPKRERADVERQLEQAGAKIKAKVTRYTDVVMAGTRAAKSVLELAQKHDVPTITPDDLLTLIREGQLELGGAGELAELGDTFGELRAAFDLGPSPETWNRILQALERCDPARRDDVAPYTEDHIKAWAVDEKRRGWSSMFQWESADGGLSLGGDLRVAPLAWVNELLDGQTNPFHALARALTLSGTRAKTTRARKLFTAGQLGESLRVLDLGRELKLTKTFFKALASAKNLGSIDTLIYYNAGQGCGELLAGQTSMPELRALHLRAGTLDYDASNQAAEAILQSDWIGSIERLESSFGVNEYASGAASVLPAMKTYSDNLTGLKHLVLSNTFNHATIDAGYVDQLASITYFARSARGLDVFLKSLIERAPSSLERLDLSQAFDLHGATRNTSRAKELAETIWSHRDGLRGLDAELDVGALAPRKAQDVADHS